MNTKWHDLSWQISLLGNNKKKHGSSKTRSWFIEKFQVSILRIQDHDIDEDILIAKRCHERTHKWSWFMYNISRFIINHKNYNFKKSWFI